ncbi:hypothetical protein [Bifidobacterium jacchi]|uniref:XRE family transcriptional regulator n=1 Tax=Bifidobacterium jacchi TaxID=2490545 RepID=A0A5N5RNR6_9BIFI|nr:hypothetical protein [Bifidobacterium jacchi]KAB5608381.1 hypothetical protein EHS19_01800 [Bifidobacterium jacchi]
MATSALETRFTDRARAVLASQGISVSEYAEKTGQTFDMASRRLNGKVKVSITDLANFAELTGYDPCEFLEDEFVLKPAVLAGREAA